MYIVLYSELYTIYRFIKKHESSLIIPSLEQPLLTAVLKYTHNENKLQMVVTS